MKSAYKLMRFDKKNHVNSHNLLLELDKTKIIVFSMVYS